eukprot:3636798-Rhodomonas_salina.2
MGKLSLNGEKPAAASPPSASPEADAAAAVLEKLYAAASEADKSAQISELLGIVQTAGASAFSTLKLVEHLSAGMSASPKQVNKLAGALAATKAVIEHAGPAGEPWVLQLLPKIMDCAGQKDNSVSKAARELADQIFHRGVRPQAFRYPLNEGAVPVCTTVRASAMMLTTGLLLCAQAAAAAVVRRDGA